MRMRAGVLAGVLLLMLGSGVVAQSPSPEASPEATPTYAPDDLGSAVPRRIGSLDLYVRAFGADYVGLGSDPEDRAYWLDFLAARDKGPADMVMAYGMDLGATDPALEVWAFRVIGLAAEELIEPTLVTSDIDLSDTPPDGHVDWRDFDGRHVLVLTVDGAGDWRAYYPHGEVLFVAYGDDRTAVEDVVSALGTGVVAQQPPALPETSPEATPPFAPDDLAALLPMELGGVGLTVEERTGTETMADSSEAYGPTDSYFRFEPDGEATHLVIDSDYEMPAKTPGFLKDLMSTGWMERNVRRMFHDVIEHPWRNPW